MNLNEIIKSCETVNREVEFKPVGEPTGMFFELRHTSAPEVQETIRRFEAKIRNLTIRRKGSKQYDEIAAQHADSLRIAHVAGWRWEQGEAKGRPAFSKRELKELLDNPQVGFFLREFIDDEVGTLEDFLQKSDNS